MSTEDESIDTHHQGLEGGTDERSEIPSSLANTTPAQTQMASPTTGYVDRRLGPSRKAFMRLWPASNPNSGEHDQESNNGVAGGLNTPPGDDDDDENLRTSLLPPTARPPLRQRVFSEEKLTVVWEFVRPFGNYLAYFTLLTMLLLVPLVVYPALQDKKLEKAANRSAFVMVSGTIILSARQVYLHLTHWNMPLQKFVVRILFMVPLYAFISYMSLSFHQHRVYMGTIRDFYEAFVIASFIYYLIELLGGDEAFVRLLLTKNPEMGKHKFPFKYVLNQWEMGEEFMLQCKHGVLQYVVFKTIATITTFLCQSLNVYGEGKFEWNTAYPYLCFFQNFSVMYALYCLVLFFHAVNEELRVPINWRPLGKFLCIKGVVFFTWWQGVLIYYFKYRHVFDGGSWSPEAVANGLIDYCVIVEMVGFAIAHSFTFTYTEYLPGRLPEASDSPAEADGIDVERHVDSQRRYCPPASLNEPVTFKDALWSSTVPKETLKDIRRLRSDTIKDIRRIRTGIVQRATSGEHRTRPVPDEQQAPMQQSVSDEEQNNQESSDQSDLS